MPTTPSRHAEGLSRTALAFFAVAAVVFVIATVITWSMLKLLGPPVPHRDLQFPPAFGASTFLLALGSILLERARRAVRQEKQQRFRRNLLLAGFTGACFLGTQTYGLLSLFPAERSAADASLGATAFVMMLATLHALHFTVAILFVSLVIVRMQQDRYDHEYHWGVSVCTAFWHVLGVVWLAILLVFAIAV